MSKQTEMHSRPDAIIIESLPDGGTWVTLHKNIQETEKAAGEGETAQTVFTADEVAFKFPADQECDAKSIKKDFDAWWIYGESWNTSKTAPTVEERLEALETFAAAMVNKGVLDNV